MWNVSEIQKLFYSHWSEKTQDIQVSTAKAAHLCHSGFLQQQTMVLFLNVVHQPFGQAVPYWYKWGIDTPLHKIFRKGNEWKVVKRWWGVKRWTSGWGRNAVKGDGEGESVDLDSRKMIHTERRTKGRDAKQARRRAGGTWEIWLTEREGGHERSKVRLKKKGGRREN